MSTRIAEIREKLGIRQSDLAMRIHVSRSHMANLEKGNRTIDLPTLRQCAKALNVTVADLLMPEDAPLLPRGAEADLLSEIRAIPDYDPRAILVAARAVVAAAKSIRNLQQVPQSLTGDPALAERMTDSWNSMDDGERKRAVELLDVARPFRRD